MSYFTLFGLSLVLFAVLGIAGLLPSKLLSIFALVNHAVRRKARFAPLKKRKFNLTAVEKGLLVGTQPRNQADVGFLKTNLDVTAIVSLNESHELYVPHSSDCFNNITIKDINDETDVPIGKQSDERILRLSLPVPDYQGPSFELLLAGVRFIDTQMKSGGKIFIHCNGGKGRSMALVLAYLLAKDSTKKKSIKDLYKELKQKRRATSSSLIRFPISSQSRYLRQFAAANKKTAIMEMFPEVPVSKVAADMSGDFIKVSQPSTAATAYKY